MITIVSGQSQEGVKMTLKMLQEGGSRLLTNVTQNIYKSNRREDFDYEPVKRLQHDNGWLFHADGRVLKVEPDFLKFLNLRYQYKVLFVEQDKNEMIKSTLQSLSKDGSRTPSASARLIANSVALKVARIKNWLVKQENISTLFLSCNKIKEAPSEQAYRINNFIGGWLDITAMSTAIDPQCFHKGEFAHML